MSILNCSITFVQSQLWPFHGLSTSLFLQKYFNGYHHIPVDTRSAESFLSLIYLFEYLFLQAKKKTSLNVFLRMYKQFFKKKNYINKLKNTGILLYDKIFCLYAVLGLGPP